MKIYKIIRNSISFIRYYLINRKRIKGSLDNLIRYIKILIEHDLEVSEYFRYRLWRSELTDEQFMSFIGWRKHIYSINVLNPIQYRCMTENKLLFHRYCQSSNLPVPELLGIYDSSGESLYGIDVIDNYESLCSFIKSSGIFNVILKPNEGTRGQSVLALEYRSENDCFYSPDGKNLTGEYIENILGGYTYRESRSTVFLIQERILPSVSTSNILSKNCPFSYRIITLLSGDAVYPIKQYAKAATGDNYTDNRYASGLTLLLNSDGICSGARSKKNFTDLMLYHPDTNFEFSGWEAPGYQEVIRLAEKTARTFSFVSCVAWDIVIGINSNGEEQICLLEGNNPWNIGIQEVYDKGLWHGSFKDEVLKKSQDPDWGKSPWW